MNQKYVTSLELSKQLKACGIPQESEWYWLQWGDTEKWDLIDIDEACDCGYGDGPKCLHDYKNKVSAFHVGELGEMLKERIDLPNYDLITKKWICVMPPDIRPEFIDANTEAECRGKMLLYLKQNNLI